MRIVRVGLLAVVGLLIAAVVTVLVHPPAGLAESQVVKSVRAATGLVLETRGARSLRLVPQPVLRLEDVTITNPAAAIGDAGRIVSARALEGELTWSQAIGLALGRVEIARISLTEADATLFVAASGATNWQTAARETAGASPSAAPGRLPQIGRLTLERSRIRHTDQRTGHSIEITALDATLQRAATNAPLRLDGTGTWNGERMSAKGEVAAPEALTGASGSALSLDLSALKSTARIAGTAKLATEPSFGGTASVSAADAGALARWLAQPIPPDLVDGLELQGGLTVSPSEVSVTRAKVTARGGGDTYVLENVNARVPLATPDALREVAFTLAWNGETVDGRLALPPAATIASSPGRPVPPARLDLATRHGKIEIAGALGEAGGPTARGKVIASGPSLRALVAWLGQPVPVPGGMETFALDGNLVLEGTRLTLADARISLDATKATGRVSVDVLAKRPRVTAALAADTLDLDTYLSAPRPLVVASRESATPPAPAVRFVPLLETLDAALRSAERGGPAVAPALESAVARAPVWSGEPLPLEALGALDLDLELAIAALTIADVRAAVPRLKATLDAGRLALEGADVAALGGRLSGNVIVDARQPVPTLTARVTGGDLALETAFTEAGVPVYLAGRTRLSADMTASGRSAAEIVASLAGTLETRVDNGAIVGWNVRRDWSRMLFDYKGPGPYEASARTPYTRLDAAFKLTKGTAESQALKLGGPVIGADGGGRSRLTDRTLDVRFKLQPEIAPRWNIPLAAKGAWTRLDVGLDPDDPGVFGWIGRLMQGGGGAAPPVAGGGSPGRDPFAIESTPVAPEPLTDPALLALIDRVLAKPEATARMGADGIAALKALRGAPPQ